MTRPDLHLHSTYSDGVLTPVQLVEKAASLGVTAMAITDHDIFGGADSLQGTTTPIPVIPGVELSISDMRNLHLLGYGLTEQCPLRDKVKELARYRLERAEQMLQNLCELGLPLTMEEVFAGSVGTIGRAHMGRALVAKGYVRTFQEAFDRYLMEDKPAYVPGKRLSMAEALPLMRQSGFVPVLAHPALLGKDDVTLRALLTHWKEQGLMGVEVYHPSLMGRTARLERMTRELGLMVTGGSDFHKEGDSHGTPGCICQEWKHAEEDLLRLMDAIEKEKM